MLGTGGTLVGLRHHGLAGSVDGHQKVGADVTYERSGFDHLAQRQATVYPTSGTEPCGSTQRRPEHFRARRNSHTSPPWSGQTLSPRLRTRARTSSLCAPCNCPSNTSSAVVTTSR